MIDGSEKRKRQSVLNFRVRVFIESTVINRQEDFQAVLKHFVQVSSG